jgi:hypothetical protein
MVKKAKWRIVPLFGVDSLSRNEYLTKHSGAPFNAVLMSDHKPEVEGLNIVIIGDFTPSLMQPAWFAMNQLIRRQEAEDAKIQIIHAEVSEFRLEWLRLQVTRDRFAAYTSQVPYFEPLRDFVMGTFRILGHTPISKIGINLEQHFAMRTPEILNSLGDKLAPKQGWDRLKRPGLMSLTMRGDREDGYTGFKLVRVEPSRTVANGVSFNVNDHYELGEGDKDLMGASKMVELLTKNWANTMVASAKIIESILGLA